MSADAVPAVPGDGGASSTIVPPTVTASSPLSSPAKPLATSDTSAAPTSPTALANDPSAPASANAGAEGTASAEAGPYNTQPAAADGAAPPPKYLQPSEFYPLNNHPTSTVPPTYPGGHLSPEDDRFAARGIPIFRPTLEEFIDFEAYVTRTVPWGQYSGIVKIIPPAEWTDSLPAIPKSAIADVRIKSPIQQNMLGQAGLFRQTNVEKNKSRPLSVKEWYMKSRDKRWAAPGPKDVDVTLDRDSAAARMKRQKEVDKIKGEKMAARVKRKEAAERKLQRQRAQAATGDGTDKNPGQSQELEPEEDVEINADVEGEAPGAPRESQEVAADDHTEAGAADNSQRTDPGADDVPALDPSNHHSPHSTSSDSAKTPDSTSPPLEPFYQDFDPAKAWLPEGTAPTDYTPEACSAMERKFWKTMGLGEPSWYGADLQGTLFPDPKTPWNVAHLPNLLNRLGRELPGVNRPYLYFGMWRAAFAWHVEDMDLFSINYIHFGAPKFWYAIPQLQAEHFERTIQGYFPREAKQCDQFLRHKSYIMSPNRLAKDGIHVNMLVHNQGEFVITYPRGYHAGFNMGFNCAESVNFALDSWVELGRRAKVCQCVNHSVRIDVDELLGENERAAQEKRMKTEQDLIAAIEEERTGRKKRPATSGSDKPRKRARKEADVAIAVAQDEDEPMVGDSELDASPEVPAIPVRAMEKKRKTIPLDAPKERKAKATMPRRPSFLPCVLCPDLSSADLFEVYQPGDAVKNMCKSEDGVVRAHGDCATSVPEVWIGEEEGKDFAMGINEISKARWALKCQICTDKKLAAYGAKVQCVSGKCPRAFHVSCARDDEAAVHRIWEVEEFEPVPIPDDAPEGTQQEFVKAKHLKVETLCPTHNPEFKELKKRQAAEALKAKVLAIIPGQTVKIRSSRGMFEVTLVRVLESEQKAEVRHENGSNSIVKWGEFDFRPAVVHKPIENEYARVHTHTRRPDGTVVPIEPPQSVTPATSSPAPAASRKQAKSPKQLKQPKAPRAKPTSSQPLSVRQMPNPPAAVPQNDSRHIPSRVVVCDSDPRQQPHAYGPPPAAFLSQGPSTMYAPSSGHGSVLPHGHAYPVPGHLGYAGPSYPAPMHYETSDPYGYAPVPGPGYGQSPYAAYGLPLPSNGHAQYSHPHYPSPSPMTAPYLHAPSQGMYTPAAPSRHQSRPQVQGWSPVGAGSHGKPLPPVSADVRRSSSSSSVNHMVHPVPSGARAYSASPSVFAPQALPPVSTSYANGPYPIPAEQNVRRASSSAASRSAQVQPPALFTSQPRSSLLSNAGTGASGSRAGTSAGVGKIDLGLERMKRLMQLFPPLQTPAIHLAGTNGKGSVSAMVESVLRQSGLRVARYNSPHLIEPRDAIALDGTPPSVNDYQIATAKVQHLAQTNGIEATTFELATAAAFDLINAYRPDVMIIECGMGGIGDATNVIPPELVLASGLTSVGLDHTAFLGNDLEAITEKKAGIAVPGGVLVVGSQVYNGVARVARRVAEEQGARVVFAEAAQYVRSGKKATPILNLTAERPHLPVRTIRVQTAAGKLVECDLGLAGEHQLDNASLAINLITTILSDPRAMQTQRKMALVSDESIKRGIAATRWKGRCELLSFRAVDDESIPVLVDGAHNFDSASTLRRYIDSLEIAPTKHLTWVLGLSDSKGKTPESVLQPLLRPGDRVVCAEFADVEGMPWVKPVRPEMVARIAEECKAGGVTVVKDVRAAMDLLAAERKGLKREEQGLIVVAGSLYLVADFYRLIG